MAKKIDWHYHRKNCQSCAKALAVIEGASATVSEVVDARKVRYGAAEAVALARQADELYVAQGKNVERVDLRTTPLKDQELADLLLGPTGNLRAPTIRRGKKLFVGFNAEMYAEQFG